MDLLDKLKIPAIIKKREETFHITECMANSQRYELDVDVFKYSTWKLFQKLFPSWVLKMFPSKIGRFDIR